MPLVALLPMLAQMPLYPPSCILKLVNPSMVGLLERQKVPLERPSFQLQSRPVSVTFSDPVQLH